MRNVIFDLGGVVLEWNPDRILEGYYTDAESRSLLKSTLFGHADWGEFDRGGLDETQLVARARQRSGRSMAEVEGLLRAARESLRLKADTLSLIEQLAARNVPLYCLSNMPASTWAYLLERYSFWPIFRGIVISAEILLKKPDRACFEYLLHRYALEARQTVFIDDSMPNVESARSLGLHALHFQDARQCAASLEALLDVN